MSMSQIKITLNLDDKGSAKLERFITGLDGLDKKVSTTNAAVKKMEGSVAGVMSRMRDLLINVHILSSAFTSLAHATAGLHMNLINANAQIERTTFLLKGLSTASTDAARMDEAKGNLEFLLDMAERTPFALKELSNSFVKMKTVGIDPTAGSLKSLTDAVAAFGGDDQLLHRATIAIQQMAGKGVVSMEELRQQLGEAVPTALRSMAKGAGVSIAELVDKVSTGTVEAQSAIEQMLGQFEREMGGSGERMMQTWTGMVSVLETRWMKFQLQVGETEYFQEAKSALQELIDALDPSLTEGFAKQLGAALASMVRVLTDAALWLKENWYWLQKTAEMALKLGAAYFVITRAFKLHTAAIAAYKTAMFATLKAGRQNLSAHQDWSLQIENNRKGFIRSTRAAGAFQMAMGGVRKSTVLALGPLGILYGVLGSLAAAFVIGDVGKSEFEEIAEGADILSEAQLEVLQNQLSINKELLRTRKLQAQEELTMGFTIANTGAEEANKKVEADILAVEEKIREARERFDAAYTGVRTRELGRELESRISVAKAAYSEESNALFEMLDKKEIASSEYRQRHAKLVLESARAEREILVAEQARLKDELFNANDFKEEGALQTQLNNISQALDRNGKQIIQYSESVKRGLQTLGDAAKPRFVKFLDKQKATFQSFNKTITKSGQAAEQFRQRVKDGFFDDKGYKASTLTNEQIEIYARLVENAAKAQENAQIRMSNYRNAVEGVGSMFANQVQKIAELRAEIGALDSGMNKNESSKLLLQLDSMAQQIPQARGHVEALKRSFLELNNAASNLEITRQIAELMNELDDEVKVLSISDNPSLLSDLQEELLELARIEEGVTGDGVEAEEARERAMQARIRLQEKYALKNQQLAQNEIKSYKQKTAQILASLGTEEQSKIAAYEAQVARIHEEFELSKTYGEERVETEESMLTYLDALNRQHAENMKTPVQKLMDEWEDASKGLNDVWKSTMEGMADGLTDFAMTGKANFADFANSIIRMILKIMIQKQIAGIVGSMFGSTKVTKPSTPSVSSDFGVNLSGYKLGKYANGGIMTSSGDMPLKKYSTGGIANSPQLALFGEGDRPEAYVPLPDGRTIPVTMRGGAGGNVQVNINNNADGATATASEREGPNGKVIDVMIENAVKKGMANGSFDKTMQNSFGISRRGK